MGQQNAHQVVNFYFFAQIIIEKCPGIPKDFLDPILSNLKNVDGTKKVKKQKTQFFR